MMLLSEWLDMVLDGDFKYCRESITITNGFKYFLFSPLFGEDSHFDQYVPTVETTNQGRDAKS